MPHRFDGWLSTQLRTDSGSIESDQSIRVGGPVVANSDQGARLLGRLYWLEIVRTSRGLVRAREHGGGVELRLAGRGPALLRFGPLEVVVEEHRVACRYPIRGGLLALREGGALVLSQVGGERPELHTAVNGFFPRFGVRAGFPRWSGPLYELVQRHVHVAISRRYFARVLAQGLP